MTTIANRVQEFRYAARRLAASPVFAGASVAVLALTLGVGTALFSVINSLLLRPMPFEERPGIVRVTFGEPGRDRTGVVLPQSVARQLVFAGDFSSVDLAGYARKDLAVSTGTGPRVLLVEAIAGSYFSIVEARAAAGRLIRHEDTDRASPPVAVISERLWRSSRHAGFDPFNQAIVVGGRAIIVVGVVAEPFQGLMRGISTDVWVPAQDQEIGHVFGRLRGRATSAQADAEVKGRVFVGGLDARYEGSVIGIGEGLLGSLEVGLAYVAGAASLALCGIVVLVAGASVTNLFIARTSGRQAEIAVRLVLGAEPADIRRLVSAEVILIALTAGALSVGSAMLTVRLAADLLIQSDRVVLNLQPDWRILSYAALATFVTVAVISRIIASYASRIDALAAVSASAGAGGSTSQSDRVRNRLLAAQVGGSTMLLVLAGLLIRSASSGLSYPEGFDPTGAAVGWIDHRSHGHDDERARDVERRILETARATSGAASAAIASTLTFDGRYLVASVIADNGAQAHLAKLAGVSTQFFSTFGLEVRRGRDFRETEVSAGFPVAVLSESAAMTLWPKGDPIGRTFRMSTDLWRLEREWVSYTLIGVVADTPAATRRPYGNRVVFVPFGRQSSSPHGRQMSSTFAVLMRARDNSQASLRLLRASVTASGSDLALQNPSALDDAIEFSGGGRRASGLLLTAIGLLAAVIALVGVYGLTSHSVNRRQREFGVLIALGATNRALLVSLAAETGRTLGRGALYGIAASVPGAFMLRRYVWDLQPFDWIAVTAVPALLLAAGLTAAVLPLRRAIRRPVADLLKTA